MKCIKCNQLIPDGSVFCNHCGKKQVVSQPKSTVHRRAKGTGTIRLDKRKANPYIVYAPRTSHSSAQRYLASFKTRKEAQLFLESYVDEQFPELYNAKLSEVYELWKAKHFPTLSRSGELGYQAAYKSISKLSNSKMRLLKTADFQECVDSVAATGASRSKLEKIRQLCSQLCKYSMENDIIDKNYAQFITLPKREKKDKNIFTEEDRRVLWEHSADKRVQIILVMIYTGFRIGELAMLKKTDINFDTHYMVGGEKTEAGRNRVVPFPTEIPEIEQFVARWCEDSEGEVLINKSVKDIREKMFYPCLAELGLIAPPIKSPTTGKDVYVKPRLTPHCTRHTFASICVEANLKPENLQKIIGHADFSTTANIYVHQDVEQLKREMGKIKK